ncbi:MAG: nucleotidyl transferase AbiEii/AbiGii toxin family protein [bacterium]|nr:nucleotidyl transferase AbiEii/AbiGii toxin family protein [bacterium]
MEQKILKDWQESVLRLLAKEKDFQNFYLSGGTALAAYYEYHRISDDLDFFSFEAIDSTFIHAIASKIKDILNAKEMRFSRLYDRNQFFYLMQDGDNEAKIEFSKYPFKQLKPTINFDGITVDSEYDLAVNKLAALLDRFDPKDFVDMYFLLQKYSLAEIREGYEKKFGTKTDPIFLGSELNKASRIEALPKMIKKLNVDELKTFFIDLSTKLKPEILE